MKQLTIALGDFCHTTKIMANNFVPLNISLIASFAKKKFGTEISIHLFKSVQKMEQFIRQSRPEIVGLSHYLWNSNLSQYILHQYKQRCPEGIAVLGGPNISKEPEQLSSWLFKRPFIDFIIDTEGEKPFANIIERVLSEDFNADRCKETGIRGCYSLGKNGHLFYEHEPPLDNLDEIPSPYLGGILDQFLLEKVDGFELYPFFESMRGCPFQCTFCRNSVDNKKIRAFSPDYFLNEVEYVAILLQKQNKQDLPILIADQNFGIYERDSVIAEGLQKLQEKYGFPKQVIVTTGKGNYENVLKTVNIFPTINITFSVQSLNKQVLHAIKRKNFPLHLFKQYHNERKKQGQYTVSEIIMGLPEDSKGKHLSTINTLLSTGIDFIIPYSFMMLPGTPSESLETRMKYQYGTKWRLIPGAFSESNNTKIFEVEEIVVSTNTLTADDYVYLRRIHLWVMGIFNGSIFKELRKLLIENKINFDVYLQTVDLFAESDDCPKTIKEIIREFTFKAQSELFESPEQLNSYYTEHWSGLIDDKTGENLLQKYTYMLYLESDGLAEIMINSVLKVSKIVDMPKCWQAVFDVMRIRARCIKQLLEGTPPTFINPINLTLNQDIIAWLQDSSTVLQNVKFDQPVQFIAFYSDDTIQYLKFLLNQYGNSSEGRGRALYRMGVQYLNPRIIPKTP